MRDGDPRIEQKEDEKDAYQKDTGPAVLPKEGGIRADPLLSRSATTKRERNKQELWGFMEKFHDREHKKGRERRMGVGLMAHNLNVV